MNHKHLGDALDHWKGNMFRWLRPALRDLNVVPMFTDADPTATWTNPALSFFAQLLGVPDSRIMHPQRRFTASGRRAYFADLCSLNPQADIFFDPDNGIATNGRASALHITPKELAAFLPRDSDRVLLVYQHSSRVKEYVRAKLAGLTADPHLEGIDCLAYGAGSVAMIFASRSPSRMTQLLAAMAVVPEDANRVVTHDASPSDP